MNREGPYNRLKRICQNYVREIKYRRLIPMFKFKIENINANDGFDLKDVYERTISANQLGYEVVLISTELGLEVKYRKKIKEEPYEIRV